MGAVITSDSHRQFFISVAVLSFLTPQIRFEIICKIRFFEKQNRNRIGAIKCF
jgi:hypothetical protein